MKKKTQITKSLSTLAQPGQTQSPEEFEIVRKAFSKYIGDIGVVEINYSLKYDAYFPIEIDVAILRSSHEKLLVQYALDLKSRQITFANLDDLKIYLIKKIGLNPMYLSILDMDQIFKYIIKDEKKSKTQSNVAKYLKTLGMDETAIKEGFTKYASIYKEKYLDSIPEAQDDHLLNSFRIAFQNLSNMFHLTFTENDDKYFVSIIVKKHLHALDYDNHGAQACLLETYANNYIGELRRAILEKKSYPVQILINHELFNTTSNKIGVEPSKALKKEIAIHEILHALGLSHPEEKETMHYTKNKTPCTIMEASSDYRYLVSSSFFSSIGPNDIVALEGHGYRMRQEAYQGNTALKLGTENHPTHKTITTLIDRDGYNTLDTTLYTGSKEVYINLSYGCSNPSIVGDELYFLDYDSKFNAVKTGNSSHKIDDTTKNNVDFFLGEGPAIIKIYSKTGHKVIYNFDSNKHKVLASPSLNYQTDEQGNCVGNLDEANKFSITFNEQVCEDLGLGGLISDKSSEL